MSHHYEEGTDFQTFPEESKKVNDPVTNFAAYEQLEIQKAANVELLRKNTALKSSYDHEFERSNGLAKQIMDVELKHQYQTRRADEAEKRIFELREQLDAKAVEAHDLREELELLKHIIIEVANGRFQRVPKAVTEIPANIIQSDLNVTPRSFDHGGETVWPFDDPDAHHRA